MPVVLFYGDEDYLMDKAVQALRKSAVDPGLGGLSHRILSKPGLAEALEVIGSIPLMLGGQTLVEIREFWPLAEASKEIMTDQQIEELKALLETVESPKTVLFINSRLDGKIKFSAWLLKHPSVRVQKFERLKFWETDKAIAFICDYAAEEKARLENPAAELLVHTLGTDLRSLINEVDKLMLYAANRPITSEDVRLLCGQGENLFQLVQQWILRDRPAAGLGVLQEILGQRHPIEVFATIQGYYGTLFRVIWFNSKGATIDTIAQRTGQKPYTIKKNLAQFRSVPMKRWITLKHQLVEMEWKTKTGQLDGQLALEVLLSA
jgi:DNA polymerase-3 subunit delta